MALNTTSLPWMGASNTGIAAPQTATTTPTTNWQGQTSSGGWFDASKWDPNNFLQGVNPQQFSADHTFLNGQPGGNTYDNNTGELIKGNTDPYLISSNGTRLNLTKGADGTYTYNDTYDDPGGTSEKNKMDVSYIYDPATGVSIPKDAVSRYQASDWVSNGQPIAQVAAAMAAAYLGGTALAGAGGSGGAGAGSMITADGAAGTGIGGGSAATGNMALIDSGLGTAGYGGSSAGTIALGDGLGSAAAGAGAGAAAGGGGTATGTAAGGGSMSQLVNGAKAVGAAGSALGGGSSGGTSGNGSSSSNPLGSFVGSLLGGSNNNLLNSLLTAYTSKQSGDRAQKAYDDQIAQINGLYAPDSAYAKQMQQTMDRKDAAAGRNSQYGTRAVELAANLTKSKADSLNSANMTNLISQSLAGQNQFPAALNALMNGSNGAGGSLGSSLGNGISSGASSLGSWLNSLFSNTSGSSSGGTIDPNAAGVGDQTSTDPTMNFGNPNYDYGSGTGGTDYTDTTTQPYDMFNQWWGG
jgi:hypothetical protein